MRLHELVRQHPVWTSAEEQHILEMLNEPRDIVSFTEREQTVIESLIRKSLVIKVKGNHSTYVYPNSEY